MARYLLPPVATGPGGRTSGRAATCTHLRGWQPADVPRTSSSTSARWTSSDKPSLLVTLEYSGLPVRDLVALRLPTMPILALAHSARSTTGSSTAWITVAVAAATFLLTAGLTLLVQLYIVPRVETRKRRDDRWERNVLELGELLTTQVRRLAQEARRAQSMVRFLYRDLEGVVGVDQEQLERERRESGPKARQATEDFHDLVNTRLDWLEDRIRSFASPRPARPR